MGIPLLFTEPGGGTPDLTVVPFPGLYLDDELYLGDDVYLDDGPTLQFYAVAPTVGSFGVTVFVTPVEATFSGGVATLSPAGPGAGAQVDSGAIGALYAGQAPVGGDDEQVAAVAGEITVTVVPTAVTFDATAPQVTGQDVIVVVDGSVPVVFGATPPDTQGGLLLILVPSVRELPPLRLSIGVETPSGRHFRWGEDEPNPVNVPSGLRFSDTMPGGFESQDVTLPRKPNIDYSDLARLSTVTVTGAGGQIAWQGRLERVPRTSGDERSVSPQSVGWQAALDDDKSATMVYIDADLSNWRGPGLTRQDSLKNQSMTLCDFSVEPDPSGTPGIKLSITGTGTAPTSALGPRAETYYEVPGGSKVASLFTDWSADNGVGTGGGAWAMAPFMSDDETAFFDQGTDQLTGATQASTFFYTPATPRRIVMVSFGFLTAPWGTAGVEYAVTLKNVRVFGDHGLTIRGTYPRFGFFGSDIVTHAVKRWAPVLNVTSTSVQQSGFLVEQAAFRDATTASEIVKSATRFGLQDWGVWDDKTFWWADRGTHSRFWRARTGPSQLSETGPQVDRLYESVIVQYQDVDGSTKSVGPVGSGCNFEESTFKDPDPENPANQAGITRRALLTMGTAGLNPFTHRPGMPIEVGRRFLEEQKLLDHSGQARFVGHVESDRGVFFPYWAPRAGDYVSFIDAADTSLRRIVKTEKDHASRTCTVDLDSPPEGLQALLERLGVVLTDLALS